MPEPGPLLTAEPTEQVAQAYPPLPAVEPVRGHRVHWLLALPVALVALLLPRRMGPHLAVSSWAAAYVVHFLSIVLAFGNMFAFAWEMMQQRYDAESAYTVLTVSEWLRRPLAGAVMFCYEAVDSWPVAVGAALGVIAVEVLIWVAAVVLIPWYAAGETRRRVYLRSVKLLLWSTVGLIPLGYCMGVLESFSRRWTLWYFQEEMVFSLFLGWAVWYFSFLLRLGGRYPGPKQGPGWEPRALHCETCHYELTMLPVAGRCPECGHAVAESLPGVRRLPDWAVARGVWGWVGGFARTFGRSLFATRFARTLRVLEGQRAARRFAWWTCVVAGLLAGVGAAPFAMEELERGNFAYDANLREVGLPAVVLVWPWLALPLLIPVLLGGLMFLGGVMLTGAVVALFGFRDATRRCVPLCYSSAWLLLPVVLGIPGIWAISAAERRDWFPGCVELPVFGSVDHLMIFAMAVMLPAFTALLLWYFHLRRLLRGTRYANS